MENVVVDRLRWSETIPRDLSVLQQLGTPREVIIGDIPDEGLPLIEEYPIWLIAQRPDVRFEVFRDGAPL